MAAVTEWLCGNETTPFRVQVTYDDATGALVSVVVNNQDTVAWKFEIANGSRSRSRQVDIPPGTTDLQLSLPAPVRNAIFFLPDGTGDYYCSWGPR